MATVHKKIWPEYFEKIVSGAKNWDLRLADFRIQEGDTIIIQEWDPEKLEYTGREVVKAVGYVGKWKAEDLDTIWPRKEVESHGLQVISLLDQ